ncbi:rRNA-processing protein NOP12 NDAI_0A08510 [Naumovozyma dairenensis CBS 421]|uniref:Nucleolar protein 12 n=1 Tax=Naumovozyma dairenensis (strain ATCC 10597 / BCRC 20456 / CBS 421 / NBRC 0211 / NRRL Y-12639) TaxID=1071378 RepID=G0W5B6_NAUDC|nr:hypothetical protein NDAI_0A08510 [Naumovozyma dairenensis CBS 421]CCD23004.1 hypothetical protein NDAI_0A08510 [Naumovozyma dairenensis CBS 421]
MSSSIDSLFGSVDSNKLESNISKLFNASSGPIDNLQVKNKHRTLLPSVKRKQPELESKSKSESGSGSESEKDDDVSADGEADEPELKKQKKSKKKKNVDGDDDEDLEGKYFAKLIEKEDSEEAQKDSREDASTDDHESEKEIAGTSSQVAKKTDLKEEELAKAERTVFIGNIPNDVITSKTVYKTFKKLFNTNPKPKKSEDEDDDEEKQEDIESKIKENPFTIESIRFRSISFDEALPRKVAFVQQKLHKSRDSVNAYIVYKNKNIVKTICSELNGTVFHNHHLRVDSVAHPSAQDKKRSIFVGNLDFEEAEESLWNHFKSCGEIEYVRIIRDAKTNMGKGFAYVQFKELQSVNKALLLNDKVMMKSNVDKDSKKKGRKLRVTRCKNMRKNGSQSSSSNFKNSGNLSDFQKTKVGRAKKILGKADRATLGQELTIEGLRATKGENVSHLKKKKQRSKTGRVTKRSQAFKKANKD